MSILQLVFMVAALVLFILAAVGTVSRINLTAAGLACWVAAELLSVYAR